MLKQSIRGAIALAAFAALPRLAPAQAVVFEPLINDPGDVIIGDSGADNNFVHPDALDLSRLVYDITLTTPSAMKWSYWEPTGTIRINGVEPLPASSVDLALDPDATTPVLRRVDAHDLDTGAPGQDADPRTITFRNAALSPSNAGPFTDPGGDGIATSQTRAVTLFASNGTTATDRTIVVYTSNNTSDSLSTYLSPQVLDVDLAQHQDGWIYALFGGTMTPSTASGLCVSLPLAGENAGGWAYIPEIGLGNGYLPLVDENVWRVRTHATYSGGTKTPLFAVQYTNTFFAPGNFNVTSHCTYDGSFIIVDNQGGANGVGTANRPPGAGRDFYDLWLSPPSMLLPGWRGLVDPDNSAFAIEEDPINDTNLLLLVLDVDSAGLDAASASGTLCLTRFQSVRTNIYDIWNPNDTPLWGPPLSNDNATGTFSPADFSLEQDIAETRSIGRITNGIAHYQMTPGFYPTANPYDPGEVGSRKTLLPYDRNIVTPFINFQLYPIAWTTDKLYLYEAQGYAEGGSDDDPFDMMHFIGFEPTIEFLTDQYVLRGFKGYPHNHMYRAGSLRLPENVNHLTQRYVTLYYTHNKTLVTTTDGPDRITPRIGFANFGSIIGSATDGQGKFAITSMKAFDLGNPQFD